MTVLRVRPGLLLIFSVLLLVLSLPAQEPRLGAFAGVVRDEQGRPLVDALVTFSNVETSQVSETRTGKDGRFHQGDFLPGRYLIAVRHNGETVWSFPVQLPSAQPILRLEIDLRKVREVAELERRRVEERQRLEMQQRIQGHLNRGVRALDEDHPQQAMEEFAAALELDPDHSVAHGMLAAAYAAADRLPGAMASYHRALEFAPGEAAYTNNLGTVLARVDRLQEALAHFQRAAASDPDRVATYHFNSGAALLNAGRAQEAVSFLRQAVRSDPTLAVAHYFLGLALLRTSPRSEENGRERGQPLPDIIASFRHYLQLAPDGPSAGQARDHLRQFDALTPDLLLPVVEPSGLFD